MENFYQAICRRPLIDVIQGKEEEKFWTESFNSSNDITLYSWRNDWLKNTETNLAHFKYFNRDHSVKILANELIDHPCLILGAGPSLENNIQYVKSAKEAGIKIIASHHSLMYLAREDVQVKPDYVVVLDAGKMWDDYFAFGKLDMKDIPLIADQTCNTEQLKQWEGPVIFYKSAHPEGTNIGKFIKMELDRLTKPNENGSVIEVGGHVTGAMLSIARGIMQSNTIIFAGTDYCFTQQGKFYPFDHKIDQVVNIGGVDLPAPPPQQGYILDIFGNMCGTNGAYLGFKNVMDIGIKVNALQSLQTGGNLEFINACEGGSLGALKGGNSQWMKYLRLEDAIHYALNKMSIPKEV